MTNSFHYAPWVVRTTPTVLYRTLKKSEVRETGAGVQVSGHGVHHGKSFQHATHFLSLSLNLWETAP
jgi:hypothetical protein